MRVIQRKPMTFALNNFSIFFPFFFQKNDKCSKTELFRLLKYSCYRPEQHEIFEEKKMKSDETANIRERFHSFAKVN